MEKESKPLGRPAPPPMKASNFFLVMIGVLGIMVMFDPTLRTQFGLIVGTLLMPVIGFNSTLPILTLMLAGILTSTLSTLVRHHYTDWVRMARMQKINSYLMKQRMEATRKGQTGRLEKITKAQLAVQRENMDLQFAPLKVMALTFFFFLIIFAWLNHFVYSTLVAEYNIYFAVPWSSKASLLDVYVVFPSWLLLYSLLALPFSQVVQRALKYFHFKRKLAEKGPALELGAA